VLGLLTTVVFLALYFSAFHHTGRSALFHIIVLLALGAAWAPYNLGANVFFIYAAAIACRVGPPRHGWMVLATIVALVVLLGWLVQPHIIFGGFALLGAVVVGLANIHFTEQERLDAALRLSQAETRQLARVAERERIARDLHDLLGHRLSMIVLNSELAGKLIDRDPERAREQIRAVEHSARAALTEVREAIGGYRERSLKAELDQVRLALTSAGVEPRLEVDEKLQLDSRTEAVLGLVIREACTNVIRHARAHHCRIRLGAAAGGDGLELEVSDDGHGRIRAEGGGIDGMRARIEALGGDFRIDADAHSIHALLPAGSAS
jgi:two-component system, NarL family, sensor histidine kinase DesK